MLLEENKISTFFKVSYDIFEFGGPLLVQDSTLVSSYELEVELSKLKDKWAEDIDSLKYFTKNNIRAWTMDYINLNNNIFVILSEARDEVIEIKKYIYIYLK